GRGLVAACYSLLFVSSYTLGSYHFAPHSALRPVDNEITKHEMVTMTLDYGHDNTKA
ncbi:hypothetical protein PTMSG1_02244, partial [Pyrenophora teres f. maculata]